MLIICQNREEIINTENVIRISIQEYKEEYDSGYEIGVDTSDGNYYTLGRYAEKSTATNELSNISRNYPYEEVYEMLWE